MFGIVIDKKTGLVLDRCVIIEDYEPKETEEVVPYEYSLGNPVGTMNKPRWIGREWIDTAPLPPIEEIPQQPNEMEVLQKENKQLWDTVEFLLKANGNIPNEVN